LKDNTTKVKCTGDYYFNHKSIKKEAKLGATL